MLFGQRLATLVQSDDPALSFSPVGATPVVWKRFGVPAFVLAGDGLTFHGIQRHEVTNRGLFDRIAEGPSVVSDPCVARHDRDELR